MKNFIKLFFIFLFFGCLPGFATTVTLTISGTTQVINLGAYGDITVTQLNLTCGASATSYKWSVNGAWQTTTGQTNSFNTTVNHITLVRKPGYGGCGDGTVSVSNGGGGSSRTGSGPDYSQSIFSYIVTLQQTVPTMMVTGMPSTILNCALQNPVTNISSYTWNYAPQVSQIALTANAVTNATITINPSQALIYTGSVTNSLIVGGAASCNLVLIRKFTYQATTGGGPGSTPPTRIVCERTYDEEGEFYYDECHPVYEGRYSPYPNPASHHFHVAFDPAMSNSIFYLHDSSGKIVARQENPTEEMLWQTAELPEGMYILRCVTRNSTTYSKIFIRHQE